MDDVKTHGIRVPVDETLEALDHGRNWTKGTWVNDEGMCLHHGIRQCQVVPGDAYLIEQVAEVKGWGTSFNDDPEVSFDDLKQEFVQHREIPPGLLAEVFGPQWEIVVRVTRQVTGLVDDPARLSRFTSAVGLYTIDKANDARHNLRLALSYEGQDWFDRVTRAPWVAASRTFEPYGQVLAEVLADAAVGAVAAVVASKLPSPSGFWRPGFSFTRLDYDLLTAPWRSMFPDFDQ